MKKVLFLFLIGLMGLTACEKEVQEEQQTELTDEFAELLAEYPELTTEELKGFSSKTSSVNTGDFPEVGDELTLIIHSVGNGTSGGFVNCSSPVQEIKFGYSTFYQKTLFLIKFSYIPNVTVTHTLFGSFEQFDIETENCSPNYPSNTFNTYKCAAKINAQTSFGGNYDWKQFACAPATMTLCNLGETPKIVMGKTTDGRVMFVNW